MRVLFAALAATLACAFTATATADDGVLVQDPQYTELARVASIFAQQPVSVTCQTPADDPELYTAWGYVFLHEPVVHMSPYLCDAAVHLGQYGAGVTALGILVLTHEALHLRKSWSARADEAKVECRAIRHFRVAAQMLGYTPEQATTLRAWALAFHWRLAAKIPDYNLASCVVPKP